MPDLTTTHLQHLLDQATPGTWSVIETYPDGAPRPDMSRQIRSANGEYLGIMHGQNAHLTALTPELAQEVICLREQVKGLILAMETKAANNEQQGPAIIASYLKEIVLGDTNE